MPVCDSISGLKTARVIQQVSTEIKIIFISDKQKLAVDAFEVGAEGYLLSPIEKEKFDLFFS